MNPALSEATDTSGSRQSFQDPSADIILRSSDNIDFRAHRKAHRLVLALASPVFEHMFPLSLGRSLRCLPFIWRNLALSWSESCLFGTQAMSLWWRI
ncbi:hypothetical protein DFH06DRAFT_688842 [Mycena polygramma]|nr:hypothetical protein DFH06DRAFT_688842 [Mycena polygramma]